MRIPILNKLMDGPEKRAVDRAARFLDQGKTEQAITALRSGLNRSPKSADLLLEMGRALALAGRWDESGSHLRTLIRTGGDARDRIRELAEMGKLQGLEVGHIHDVLAEQSLREGRLAEAQEHLEKIPADERARFADVHRKRFQTGIRNDQERPARAVLVSGIYVALAHEASGNDAAALEFYGKLLKADPESYSRLSDRLQAMSSRNYRNAAFRMEILDLHAAHGDGTLAGNEANLLIEAAPQAAGPLAERLETMLASRPEDPGLRMALARSRWAEGRADEAAALLEPLVHRTEVVPELPALLGKWRVDRPDAGKIALLQAELLGRGGKGSQAVQAIFEVGSDLGAEETEPALERVLERNPKEARAWRLLAELRRSTGNIEGALDALVSLRREAPERADEGAEVLRNILGADPTQLRAHSMLSEILLDREELETAVTVMRHLVCLDPGAGAEMAARFESLAAQTPKLIAAKLGAAEAWMAAGEVKKALPHLRSAAGAGAGHAAQVVHRMSRAVHQAPQVAGEIEPAVALLEGNLTDPAAIPFLRAELAAASGDPERAAASASECYGLGAERAAVPVKLLLESILEKHPRASGPRMLLANILTDQGEPLRAVSLVAEAPDPDPGAVSLLLERLEAALAGKQDPAVQAGVARLLLFAGRVDEALETAERTLKAAGAGAPPVLHLVRGTALLSRGEVAAAVQAFRLAAAGDPDLAASAVESLEGVLEIDPDNTEVCRTLGMLRLELGQVAEGLALLVDLAEGHQDQVPAVLREFASLRGPASADPRVPLAAARLHVAVGDPVEAAKSLAQAEDAGAGQHDVDGVLNELLERTPDDPGVLLVVGRAQAQRDPSAASRMLARSAELDPGGCETALPLLDEMALAFPGLSAPCCAAARMRLDQGLSGEAFGTLAPLLTLDVVAAEVLELLREVRTARPEDPLPALALAKVSLDRENFDEALQEIEAASAAAAVATDLKPMLDRIVRGADSPTARLLRSAVCAELRDLDGAVEDLDAAYQGGRVAEALDGVGRVLEAHPDHGVARRLHIRMLRTAGDAKAALNSLDQGIDLALDRAERCELLVERAGLLRAQGQEDEATRDLRNAEEISEDRNSFLGWLHQQRVQRLDEQLADAGSAERVRLLIELGRLDEAAQGLSEGGLADDEARALRAALFLAQGEAASGLQLLRAAPPTSILVDAAQRCDQPGLALAALDRLLEEREDPSFRRARSRLVRDVWRRELDDSRLALVARSPFLPRGIKPGEPREPGQSSESDTRASLNSAESAERS